MKHNKKRNIGIIFDLLLKEYFSNSKDNKIKSENIILKYFNPSSILLKEYNLYNILSSIRGMGERDSERYLTHIKHEFNNLDKVLVDEQLKLLKEDINKNFSREFYNNFIENYKVHATIYGILNETSESSIEKFELENKVLDLMRSQDDKKSFILEHSDTIVYNQYCKKFNEKYTGLNENQKNLMDKYIKSIDNDIDFVLSLNEELMNAKDILTERLKTEKSTRLKEKITDTLSQINEFKKIKKISDKDFEFVLELQNVIEHLKEK